MKHLLRFMLVTLAAVTALSFSAFADNDYPKDDDGNFYVPEYILGDVNRDGKLTASDARLALRVSANLEEIDIYQQIIADVNNDRRVTAMDARLFLRASAGLDTFDGWHVHSIVGSPEAPASCTKPGKTSSLYCSKCSMVFKEQEIIPAGHKIVRKEVPPTCTEPGYTFIEICERCGEIFAKGDVIPAKGHTVGDDGIHCKDCGETVIKNKDYSILESGKFYMEARSYSRLDDPEDEGITVSLPDETDTVINYNEDSIKVTTYNFDTPMSIISQKTPYSWRSYIVSENDGICARYDKLIMKFAKQHINLELIRSDADDGSGNTVTLEKDVVFNGVKTDVYTITDIVGGVTKVYFKGDDLYAMENQDSDYPGLYSGFVIDKFTDSPEDISFTPGVDYKEVNSLMFILTISGGYQDFIPYSK